MCYYIYLWSIHNDVGHRCRRLFSWQQLTEYDLIASSTNITSLHNLFSFYMHRMDRVPSLFLLFLNSHFYQLTRFHPVHCNIVLFWLTHLISIWRRKQCNVFVNGKDWTGRKIHWTNIFVNVINHGHGHDCYTIYTALKMVLAYYFCFFSIYSTKNICWIVLIVLKSNWNI